MPDTATVESSETGKFVDFIAARAADRSTGDSLDDVEVSDPTETGKTSEGDGTKPEPKSADGSEPSHRQETKVDKRKQQIQREIDDLVRRREELKREVSSASPTGATKQAAPAPAAYDGMDRADPEPKLPSATDSKYAGQDGWERFEEDKLKYAVERAKWEIRRDQRVATHNETLQKQQRSNQELLDAFESRGSEFASSDGHEDYPELVEQFKGRQISNETAAVIVSSDNGPAILYELMTKPDELKRIESLPTVMGRLDALFELKYKLKSPAKATDTETPAEPKTKSTAPAVGTRLNGGGGAVGSKEPGTFEAFRKKKYG